MLALQKYRALPSAYRSLNALINRNFGIYSNDSLKKNFDEVLKDKYKMRQAKEESQKEEELSLYDEMKETYKEVYQDFAEHESILKKYQQQLSLHEDSLFDQQLKSEVGKDFVEKQNHFRGITSEEFVRRSKDLMEANLNQQSWDLNKHEKVSHEYLNYDKYSKNYAAARDLKEPEENQTEPFNLNSNFRRYIMDLDDKHTEKTFMGSQETTLKQKFKDPEDAKKAIDNYWNRTRTDLKRDPMAPRRHRINIGDVDDRRTIEEGTPINGRVSPFAKEEIYRLHLDGWNIRDLSLRFGLLPERLKAIIWQRQYFYDEILPNNDLTTIRLSLEREMLYGMHFPWVDYGFDLDRLQEREQGVLFQRYRTEEIDANPPKEVQDKMNEVIKSQTKRKYEIVTEDFVGHGEKGYYIKSWIVNKGHGSERVNKKFKMAVQHSKRGTWMPDKVRMRLDKGPRRASLGYGIK